MSAPTDSFRIDALRGSVEAAEVRAPGVSAWSVGQHVEHCTLAMLGIGRALLASKPPPPSRRPAALRRGLVLLTGWIPRGRGRSPEAVVPRMTRSPQELRARLDEAAALLAGVADAERDIWFRHAALGVLDRDGSLRFLAIHNRHHARIVRDIRRAAASKANRQGPG